MSKKFLHIILCGLIILTANKSLYNDLFKENSYSDVSGSKAASLKEDKDERVLINYTYLDQFSITSESDELTLNIIFSKVGINNLFSIKQINLEDTSTSISINSCTDWISPYIVKLKKTNNSTLKERFTGGWHGSNRDGTGIPTAKTIEYKIYADEKELVPNSTGQAAEIVIKVVNTIQGYDTREYILNETIIYTISKSSIDVDVHIKALDDIIITRYYGLQSQNNVFDKEIKYLYEDNSVTTENILQQNKSKLNDDGLRAKSFTLTSDNHPFILTAWIDLGQPLASFDYLSDNKPYAFTAAYGKSYFNFINGKPFNLNANDSTSWAGGYQFSVKDVVD